MTQVDRWLQWLREVCPVLIQNATGHRTDDTPSRSAQHAAEPPSGWRAAELPGENSLTFTAYLEKLLLARGSNQLVCSGVRQNP